MCNLLPRTLKLMNTAENVAEKLTNLIHLSCDGLMCGDLQPALLFMDEMKEKNGKTNAASHCGGCSGNFIFESLSWKTKCAGTFGNRLALDCTNPIDNEGEGCCCAYGMWYSQREGVCMNGDEICPLIEERSPELTKEFRTEKLAKVLMKGMKTNLDLFLHKFKDDFRQDLEKWFVQSSASAFEDSIIGRGIKAFDDIRGRAKGMTKEFIKSLQELQHTKKYDLQKNEKDTKEKFNAMQESIQEESGKVFTILSEKRKLISKPLKELLKLIKNIIDDIKTKVAGRMSELPVLVDVFKNAQMVLGGDTGFNDVEFEEKANINFEDMQQIMAADQAREEQNAERSANELKLRRARRDFFYLAKNNLKLAEENLKLLESEEEQKRVKSEMMSMFGDGYDHHMEN